jgi:hypothetical protein
MSEFLTIDQILAANDLPSEVVEVPEWGGKVKVQGLSRASYDAIAKAAEVSVPATGPGQVAGTKRDDDKFSDLLFVACVDGTQLHRGTHPRVEDQEPGCPQSGLPGDWARSPDRRDACQKHG